LIRPRNGRNLAAIEHNARGFERIAMIKLTLATALLLSGTAALAQTPAAAPTKTTVTTTKTSPATSTVKATAKTRSKTTTTTGTGRMVQAKLANGKTVTYNCSLAGNATKKACKN
jgi:multidrug efflux pump subunit AcrA (membrane-fusion protein)